MAIIDISFLASNMILDIGQLPEVQDRCFCVDRSRSGEVNYDLERLRRVSCLVNPAMSIDRGGIRVQD